MLNIIARKVNKPYVNRKTKLILRQNECESFLSFHRSEWFYEFEFGFYKTTIKRKS